MRARVWTLAACLASSPAWAADVPKTPSSKLWYRSAITQWDEGLPLGNGRLGAMVFGDPRRDRIVLNEDSLWMGWARDTTNPSTLAHLPEVRRLLFAGDPVGAYRVADKHLLGIPHRLQSYQP